MHQKNAMVVEDDAPDVPGPDGDTGNGEHDRMVGTVKTAAQQIHEDARTEPASS